MLPERAQSLGCFGAFFVCATAVPSLSQVVAVHDHFPHSQASLSAPLTGSYKARQKRRQLRRASLSYQEKSPEKSRDAWSAGLVSGAHLNLGGVSAAQNARSNNIVNRARSAG